jgi:hypothetical protein
VYPLAVARPVYGTTINGQPITNTSPNTQARACAAGQTNWAETTLNTSPQPFGNHLAHTTDGG